MVGLACRHSPAPSRLSTARELEVGALARVAGRASLRQGFAAYLGWFADTNIIKSVQRALRPPDHAQERYGVAWLTEEEALPPCECAAAVCPLRSPRHLLPYAEHDLYRRRKITGRAGVKGRT